MARYAFSVFGDATYGGPQYSIFAADPVAAIPYDYGSVLLTWRAPGGVWDELRVIRNSLGYPVSVANGVEVYTTTPAESGTEIREHGLDQDQWVYYTIFVHDTVEDQWVHAGIAKCFVPSDYGGADRLFDLVPESGQSATLQRFLSVVGYAYDLLRNDINSLLDLHDPMAVSYDLVPLVLSQFGIPIEPELEPEQYRRLLRNAIFLYKTKGTAPCLHGLVAAITGWQCTIDIGTNLLWSADYSDFVGSLGGWSPVAPATVSWIPPTDVGGGGAMEVTSGAPTTTEVHVTERIPVIAGQTYSASALARSVDLPPDTVTIRFDWYDSAGTVLGRRFAMGFTEGFYGDERAAVPVRQGVDTAVRWSEVAPVGATSVDVVLIVNATTAGHRWQWRKIMVNEGADAPYQPGRDIRIGLDITDTDTHREAVHLSRLTSVLPNYLPLGATFTLYSLV